MAGASDKARFYLEQAVPQLREFEQKKIFNQDEIKNLVSKRSDFEHRILARGSKPVDFARYATWEISLERLRQKRCKRLRISGSSAHAGQARVFNIFDRATRKFPGDQSLWMAYLEYAREMKATNKFKAILTSAIRLHPTKSDLWLYAARWTLQLEADMEGARSYMQRGTRFCTSKDIWLEYAKLEMIYLAKVALRRKILGLDEDKNLNSENHDAEQSFDASEDMIRIPDFEDYAIQPSIVDGVKVDLEAVKDPGTTPALQGAIPLAIFNSARKQSFFDLSVAEEFFNMFAHFTQVNFLPRILQQVLDIMMESDPLDPSTLICYIKQPHAPLEAVSPAFPRAIGNSIDRLKNAMEKTSQSPELSNKAKEWIGNLLALENIDPGIETVLKYTFQKLT